MRSSRKKLGHSSPLHGVRIEDRKLFLFSLEEKKEKGGKTKRKLLSLEESRRKWERMFFAQSGSEEEGSSIILFSRGKKGKERKRMVALLHKETGEGEIPIPPLNGEEKKKGGRGAITI